MSEIQSEASRSSDNCLSCWAVGQSSDLLSIFAFAWLGLVDKAIISYVKKITGRLQNIMSRLDMRLKTSCISRPRLVASGDASCNSNVKVHITSSFDVYLVNNTEKDIELAPAEICGFGLGSFAEKSSNMCAVTPSDCLPWYIKADSHLVVFQTDPAEKKKPISIAYLIYHMAQKHGLMEVVVTDHNLAPVTEASCPKCCLMSENHSK